MGQGKLDANRWFLDKWEMYKALSSSVIGCKLPLTNILRESSLEKMLMSLGAVYIKPVDSWGGEGISVVNRVDQEASEEHLYQIRDSSGNQKQGSMESIIESVLERYANTTSIVQQRAPFILLNGAPFDVRVLMQREVDGEWTYAGALVRTGVKDSIVSNVAKSGGKVLPVGKALRTVFPDDPSKRRGVRGCSKHCAYKVCRILDGYHSFDEIGLDFGVDGEGQPWLIEVNTNDALGGPSHDLFLKLPNKELHRQITERHRQRSIRTALSIFEGLFD